MSETKTVNGRKLTRHGTGETSVCGRCGEKIDWGSDQLFGGQHYASEQDWGADRDNTNCPYCGSADTDWMHTD